MSRHYNNYTQWTFITSYYCMSPHYNNYVPICIYIHNGHLLQAIIAQLMEYIQGNKTILQSANPSLLPSILHVALQSKQIV